MSITTATNSTSPNTLKWATTDADPYDRATQLAGLAENVDLHDHSAGKGLAVARLAANAVDTASIQAGAVTSAKLAAFVVTPAQLGADVLKKAWFYALTGD